MEKRLLTQNWQKVTNDDFLSLGLFPEQSIDTIVKNLLIPDMCYDGFGVQSSGVSEVLVANGHLYNQGKVYFNNSEGGTTVDLLSRAPAATKRIVAITVWGSELDANSEPRTFLTDAETRATVARETATEHWRWANISAVSGVEGPDPQPPAVATDVCVVAWVTLTTTGIESILRNTEMYAPNLRDENNRLIAFELWQRIIGTLIETLRSDLAALAASIGGLAKMSLVRQLAHDTANLKDQLHLPSAYTSYSVDHFLTDEQSDTTWVDWLAKIEEGVRFPAAAGFDAQLGLLNVFDAMVINSGDVILPAWDATQRISNFGNDAEVSIAQYQYQTVNMVQKTMARQVTRYGTPFTVCSNSAWWNSTQTPSGNGVPPDFNYQDWTFQRDGDTFQVMSALTLDTVDQGDFAGLAHNLIRIQQVWVDTIQEPYWDRIVTNYAINGAMLAQSFLNAQDGWLCEMDLMFSKVGVSGNVDLLICDLASGMPDPTQIIARSTVNVADLKLATAANQVPTKFLFKPTFLAKGRYAMIVITTGNHYLWVLKNTNYVSGTLFYSTDGDWFQGDLVTDIAFNAYFCKFRANMTRTQLLSLQLQNGIAAIDINADTIIPDGCQLYYEVQLAGVWYRLDNTDGGPSTLFNGLPPLLPFRAVFVGTDSVQPALGVAANSRVTTWRPRANFTHVSAIRNVPACTTIQVDVRLEAWRGSPHHTFTLKLMYGASYATVHDPSSTSEEVAPDDPTYAIIRHYTFTGQGSLTQFRLRMDGTTDNVLATFHVAERFDLENPA